MGVLRIMGGTVYDPARGVDGVVTDVWIVDGRVVATPETADARADLTIDARGDAVMPAGVDLHCHIAGPKVNAARMMRPEEGRSDPQPRVGFMRSGTLGSVPSTFTTGYRYAGLGYATAVDAAVPALGARHAHQELDDTPVIDKAMLILMGNNHYVMDRIREGARGRLNDYLAWVLGASRGYGLKVVNPGGVETWKQGKGTLASLDDSVDGFGVTPRQILTELARASAELDLPHPLHLHGLNLGVPGNAGMSLETFKAIDGLRAHFAHIQFLSYSGDPSDLRKFGSGVPELADWVNTHDGISVDVGQVVFGETTSMTADGAVGQFLHELTGRKWYSSDVEMETGCGVVPITYEDTNAVHALQWAIGLEWYLRVDDPWRVVMSTDHPNGGSFLAYPQVIALLMDRGLRKEMLDRLPASVRDHCGLAELSREYSLSEIAIITRAAPARLLGLDRKGHLGPGADGDVTIYRPDVDRRRMFSLPRYLIKAGHVVLDDGALRETPAGQTLHVAPGYDGAEVETIGAWFREHYSMSFANYPLADHEVPNARAVARERGGPR
jgi:formylmethanofuran dehydrogenase subunit A